ncbi:MAG: PEGA domain-containing protein [Candidatus Levybacteria bacterium]|nr:PEGA domain-containing protein [Candidatus Levybacteria bacterium]MSU26067.1 PEGA domain-containing protein [Candidatus Levybacteria bacterium]
MNKHLLYSFIIVASLFTITTLVFIYGRGYRFNFNLSKPEVNGTGLFVATSEPDGAQVFINGHLSTATDNTINLMPGDYDVKIFKEGYFPWTKKIKVQKEVVAKAEALLLPVAPKLESITSIGISNPVIDPSMINIGYTVSSQSARKNGVYVLNMTTRLLTLQSASTQIADDTIDTFSSSSILWSPNGQEILATTSGGTMYILENTNSTQIPKDVNNTLTILQDTWNTERAEKEQARMYGLKLSLKKMVMENFHILSWSPDETKILYQASSSAGLPIIISPRLIGTNSTPEERNIKQKNIYLYDLKEDKNYKINVQEEALTSLTWLPDSKHILYVQDKKIFIADYDSTNATTIYAGPFIGKYAFPWPNGSKIVILTNLGNQQLAPNLYTISLK